MSYPIAIRDIWAPVPRWGVIIPLSLTGCSPPPHVLDQDTITLCDRYAAWTWAGNPTTPTEYQAMYGQCLKERGFP